MAINRGAGTQTVPVRRTDARRGGEGARDMAAATETRRHANAMQPAGPRERDSGSITPPPWRHVRARRCRRVAVPRVTYATGCIRRGPPCSVHEQMGRPGAPLPRQQRSVL
jgi:hypothetical protein